MTLQRALKIAEKWAQDKFVTLKEGEAKEYHSMFLTFLKEEQKKRNIGPLTLEQMEEMLATHVWIKFFPSEVVMPGILDVTSDYGVCGVWYGGDGAGSDCQEKDYGKTWEAYLYYPGGIEGE